MCECRCWQVRSDGGILWKLSPEVESKSVTWLWGWERMYWGFVGVMKSSSRRRESEWTRDIWCDCWATIRPTWNLRLWLYLMVSYFLQLCLAATVHARQRHRVGLIRVSVLLNEYTKMKEGQKSEWYMRASEYEWPWNSGWIRREKRSLRTCLLNMPERQSEYVK